jgi:hypothetical protein
MSHFQEPLLFGKQRKMILSIFLEDFKMQKTCKKMWKCPRCENETMFHNISHITPNYCGYCGMHNCKHPDCKNCPKIFCCDYSIEDPNTTKRTK